MAEKSQKLENLQKMLKNRLVAISGFPVLEDDVDISYFGIESYHNRLILYTFCKDKRKKPTFRKLIVPEGYFTVYDGDEYTSWFNPEHGTPTVKIYYNYIPYSRRKWQKVILDHLFENSEVAKWTLRVLFAQHSSDWMRLFFMGMYEKLVTLGQIENIHLKGK